MRYKIFLMTLLILLPVKSFGWFLDNGLEKSIENLRGLFEKKELSVIYFEFVDSALKQEVNFSINRMKKDKYWGPKIAKRLNFKSFKSYLKAGNDEVIRHFFHTMLYSKKTKRSNIKNKDYLQLSLALTLLVAPFDKKMKIIDYDIYNNGAYVQFRNKKLEISAYFINKKDKWYLTSKKLSQK